MGLVVATSLFAQNKSMMKSINTQAPVQCSKSITIQAGGEKVWSVLTNINQWQQWQTGISKATLSGAVAPQSTFVWKTGGATVHSTLHTVVPNEAFGWTGKTFGMYAIHNWTIAESNGVTTVAVTESMEGLLAQLLKKSFNKSLEKGMQHWLEMLKQECEK